MHGLLYSTFDEKKSPLILPNEIDEKLILNVEFNNHTINYLHKLKEEEPLFIITCMAWTSFEKKRGKNKKR